MKKSATILQLLMLAAVLVSSGTCWAKMVITSNTDHFLPGDSLPALAISIAQGAQSVHLNLVMSADNRVIVLRDTVISNLTNVADIFPEKIRQDGLFHVMDFSVEELQQLSLANTGQVVSGADETKSLPLPHVGLATLEDALGLIRAIEQNRGGRIEIIAEIKKSWQYMHENLDISKTVIDMFIQYGYTSHASGLSIASYDPEELQRIHNTLLPESGIDLKILQLVDDNAGTETKRFELGRWLNYNYDWLYTKFGLKAVSGYADIISLMPGFLVNSSGDLVHQEYVEDAHILGLKIIVYPIDLLAEQLTDFPSGFESLLQSHLLTTGADGLITEHDQLTREFLEKQRKQSNSEKKTTIELLLENVRKQQIN